MRAFELAVLEQKLDYDVETRNCGCACEECQVGHHKECDYGICWND